MAVHRLEREFLYNGVKLPDASPAMTPEQPVLNTGPLVHSDVEIYHPM